MPKSSSELVEYVRRHLDNKKKDTTEGTYALSEQISYPPLFSLLAKDQQQDALKQLSALPLSTQQLLLNEWQARCLAQQIRNPAGYLFGMIKKAQQGAFRATHLAQQSKG
ncbi:hypothetical protein RHO12_01460 [Orbus sturtevantii]|uniref:hypothetical protein n=1 Tax=Orbus sturtevantii TaxID=3074109 RepID=UPI00370DA16E